ncbi:MAG TPA: hypothetical protein VJ810_06555 [Blastocatellia bacterium]|nr:hypothetical protein [Blastocatellia bacterium]
MKCPYINVKRFVVYALALFICLSGAARPSFSTNQPEPFVTAPQDLLTESACPRCRPGQEGQIFSNGKRVQVKILPDDGASLVSFIFLLEPVAIFIGSNKESGKTVSLGPFPSGTELVFGIFVNGPVPPPSSEPIPAGPYRMGPAIRNPDLLPHANVQCLPGKTVVGFEDLPGLAAPADRDFDDAVIEVTCADVKCDTINFRPPQFFLNNISRLPQGSVIIGGVNLNAPISTNNVEAIELALRGGNLFGGARAASPMQELNRAFVAAQLSLELAGGHSSPPVYNAMWSNLGCPGLFSDFAPINLSNGATLGPDSMLKDLFLQTESAIRQSRAADYLILTNFFGELGCGGDIGIPPIGIHGKCPPLLPSPDLIVKSATCSRINPRVVELTITVKNIGEAAAAPSFTTVSQINGFPFGLPAIATKALASMETVVLKQNLLKPPGCPEDPFCRLVIAANGGDSPIAEKTRINNIKIINCF